MNSIAFPIMLNNSSTNIVKDHDATASNLKLLLLSDKTSLFGDPYFGVNLQKLFFERNNAVLRDLVIDDVFTATTLFMPQLRVERKNISVTSDGSDVYVNIKAQNMLDYSFVNYSINMLNVEEL